MEALHEQQVDQGEEQEEQLLQQEPEDEQQQVDEQPREATVPLEALEKLRNEMQEIKRQNFLLQQQLLQQTEQQKPVSEDDPLAGMDEDDVLTVGDVKKLMQKMQPQQQQAAPMPDPRLAKLQQSEAQVRAFYSDYDQKIEKLIPTIRQNPALQEAILNSPNPAMLAYQLADTLPVGQAQGQVKPKVPPPQPGENLQKPGTGVSAGGGGAVSPADRWLTMSPEEFEEEIARVKRGG